MELKVDGTAIRDSSGQLISTPTITGMLEREPERLRSALGGLRFSSRTLVAAARISGRFPTGLRVEAGATRNSSFCAANAQADHIVLDGFWYELREESRLARDSVLGNAPQAHELSSSDMFRIRAAHRSGWDLYVEVETADASAWVASLAPMTAPDGLTADLYPYQEIGVNVLRRLADQGLGCLLADQMGLGKTLQVIALLTSLRRPSLVIAPSSLSVNWVDEIAKFAPGLTVLVHAGSDRYGVPGPLRGFDVVITTYETAAADLGILEEVEWEVLVADEAQQIRNPDTNRAHALKRLPRRIAVAVTGTPVENRLRDLWSISEFVIPTLLGGREDFERDFPDEVTAARELGSIVAPLTLRRFVDQVAKDLPELTQILTALEMSPGLEARHRALTAGARNRLEVNTRLRVLCAHADEQLVATEFLDATKVRHTLGLLEEIFENSQKALVFAPFAATLDRLHVAAGKLLVGRLFLAVVDGRMQGSERKPLIDRFNDSALPGALFLNPSAAGTGLNITGANHVIHFSPEYNPQKTTQATARAYRRKQELPVFVHHLHYRQSVEEEAARIAAGKAELAEAVDEGVGEKGSGA